MSSIDLALNRSPVRPKLLAVLVAAFLAVAPATALPGSDRPDGPPTPRRPGPHRPSTAWPVV